MKQWLCMAAACMLFAALAACTAKPQSSAGYVSVSQEEAMRMMEEESGYIILDVRTKEEFEQEYIPGAINIPNEEIDKEPLSLLPDKEQRIFVYCRSGSRSKQASQKLADMGYTGVVEIGGINTWPGKTVNPFTPVLMLDMHAPNETDGVTLEVTGYSGGVLNAEIRNQSGKTYTYGEAFDVYVRTGSEWKKCEWEEERMWIMIAYELADGDTAEIACDLNGMKELNSGEFKLIKGDLSSEFRLVYSE